MKIFGDMRSGNCLKVKYVCDYLGLAYEWQEVDVLSGYTRTPEYLALNPAGQIPAVILDDGKVLAQSNAIMRYLAHDSALIPTDRYLQAKMDEWLFWEQYSHEPAIAVARFLAVFKGMALTDIDPGLIAKGDAALDRMEEALDSQKYLIGNGVTLADIALFAYTQFSEDGGFSLADRPAVVRWLNRVRKDLKI